MTLEQLLKMRDQLDALPDPLGPFRDPLSMTFMGMRVVEILDDIRPVLEVRPHVPMRPDHRAEINAWLLEMFGTRDHSPFARGTALMWAGGLAIRKSDAALLVNAI